MTCRSCGRSGVPMDDRDPRHCMVCAMKWRLRSLGPFPAVIPDHDTSPADSKSRPLDGGAAKPPPVKVTCIEPGCETSWWHQPRAGGRGSRRRCPACQKARNQARANASRKLWRQRKRAEAAA